MDLLLHWITTLAAALVLTIAGFVLDGGFGPSDARRSPATSRHSRRPRTDPGAQAWGQGGEVDSARPPSVCSARINHLMRSAECGMRNGPASIGSIGRIPGSTSALQFRIPHFAFRIGLVDWFNAVDATYRTDLRELNELNFARFDAKVEQRFVQFEAKVEQRFVQFEQRFVQLEARMDRKLAEQREFLERRLGEQTRAYYAAWAVQVAATVAVLVRVYLG